MLSCIAVCVYVCALCVHRVCVALFCRSLIEHFLPKIDEQCKTKNAVSLEREQVTAI